MKKNNSQNASLDDCPANQLKQLIKQFNDQLHSYNEVDPSLEEEKEPLLEPRRQSSQGQQIIGLHDLFENHQRRLPENQMFEREEEKRENFNSMHMNLEMEN